MRIDYLLYQASHLSLRAVERLPVLTAPIPDEKHPSDHLPVAARFVIKSAWERIRDDARQWLTAVTGTTSARPLSSAALRQVSPTHQHTPTLALFTNLLRHPMPSRRPSGGVSTVVRLSIRQAFSYFDKDGSGRIHLVELEAALVRLQLVGLHDVDAAHVRDAVQQCTDGGNVAGGGDLSNEDASEWQMDFKQFSNLYERSVQRFESGSARQLELAFTAFDLDGDGVVTVEELH